MSFNKKIGILGGGQLGRMLSEAASPLYLDLHILDKEESFPAALIAPHFHIGDFTSHDDVVAFGSEMDVISIEIEKVNLEGLVELENRGKVVIPSSNVVSIIRDKGIQKAFYKEHGFPTSAFKLYDDKKSIWQAILKGELDYPFVQKARRDGYDGQGVAIIRSEDDLSKLMDVASVVEDLVDVKKELAIIVARNPAGEMTTFPMVEMEFDPKANLVHNLLCPAQVSDEIIDQAEGLVLALAKSIELTGLLAVELFMDQYNKLWINESAPRPHNSGHHTIEACNYSQYDLHLRCLLNLSMPNVVLNKPAGMMNLLGEAGFEGKPIIEGLEEMMSISEVYPHWYGKKQTRPMRKMGHVTVLGKDRTEVQSKLTKLANQLKVIA